ncbi:hypothetical protein VP01_5872g3 [Puccinia sorghi]|uniref:Uncharacterized protein n=1 Tax=Puccinia sorghi TaxID=27349 RepID=A0A0L6UHX8_9BASI|nr:hypothetical protein VP01_5872g3 [Puccinia sorghi]
MYDRVCSIFTSYHVALPHWDTVRCMRIFLRSMIRLEVHENLSVINNKIYYIGLKKLIGHVSAMVNVILIQYGYYIKLINLSLGSQELANPYVRHQCTVSLTEMEGRLIKGQT